MNTAALIDCAPCSWNPSPAPLPSLRQVHAVLLSVFNKLRRHRSGADEATVVTGGAHEALAAAERKLAEAADATSPFVRDALFDEIVALMARAYGPTLWRFCAAQPGITSATAEDLAQQSFLTFRLALPGFERRSSLKTFLYGIATNVTRAERAKEERHARILAATAGTVATMLHGESLGAEAGAEAEARLDQERLAALYRALQLLAPREAFLVRARLSDQLDYEQILPRFQARFGDSITTSEGLRTLFFHIKKRLEHLLAEEP